MWSDRFRYLERLLPCNQFPKPDGPQTTQLSYENGRDRLAKAAVPNGIGEDGRRYTSVPSARSAHFQHRHRDSGPCFQSWYGRAQKVDCRWFGTLRYGERASFGPCGASGHRSIPLAARPTFNLPCFPRGHPSERLRQSFRISMAVPSICLWVTTGDPEVRTVSAFNTLV